VLTIDRIERPEAAEFREKYLRKGKPVVIRENRDDSPAQMAWDFDTLAATAGDCDIPVYDWGSKGPTVDDDFLIGRMTLRQAIEHAREVERPSQQRYSVCQLALEFLPPLARAYQTPKFLEGIEQAGRRPPSLFREPRRQALFLSFFRGMHWHNGREVVAQLVCGRKRFVLFSPKDSRFLYPRRFVESPRAWFDETEAVFCSEIPFENGIENIDLERFPLFRHAKPIVIDLGPGDLLYIPTHWWHYTHALEPCVLVADFWDAPMDLWAFPLAWRTVIMKPYRKYLYRRLLGAGYLTRRVKSAA